MGFDCTSSSSLPFFYFSYLLLLSFFSECNTGYCFFVSKLASEVTEFTEIKFLEIAKGTL